MPPERFREIPAPDDPTRRAVYEGILRGVRNLIRADEGWACQGLYARRINPEASPDFLIPVVNPNPGEISDVREGSFLDLEVLARTGHYHRFSREASEGSGNLFDSWHLFPIHDVNMFPYFVYMMHHTGLVVVSAHAEIEYPRIDFKIHTQSFYQAAEGIKSQIQVIEQARDKALTAIRERYNPQLEALLTRHRILEGLQAGVPDELF